MVLAVAVILSSIFRDSAAYVDRWVEQVSALNEHVPVSVVVAEGDSTDDTRVQLAQAISDADFDGMILHVDHGGPKFGSVIHPQRWAQIARVCNAVAARVSRMIGDDDAWVYVESDLVWPSETLTALLEGLDEHPAVAAMSLHPRDERFYDIWGHRGLDGVEFTPNPPYHSSLNGERWVEIDSAGSCFAMRGKWARVARFSDADCIRGIGRTLRSHGGSLWLDTEAVVRHP